MPTRSWTLSDLLTNNVNSSTPLPSELFSVIAERIEVAIGNCSRESLIELSEQIGTTFSARLATAPSELRRALRDANADTSNTRMAFSLGQLNFAHLLTAQAAERRADEDFLNAIKDRRFAKYIQILGNSDATNVELATKTRFKEETVSRSLRQLRMLGITDFRREGKNVINFLTPAARNGLHLSRESVPDENISTAFIDTIAKMKVEMAPYMKHSLTFSAVHDNSYALAA